MINLYSHTSLRLTVIVMMMSTFAETDCSSNSLSYKRHNSLLPRITNDIQSKLPPFRSVVSNVLVSGQMLKQLEPATFTRLTAVKSLVALCLCENTAAYVGENGLVGSWLSGRNGTDSRSPIHNAA